MEILQLKYFAESAKTENFSATANKYLVPVSSVSASVRKLESELGCKLFDRNANKIKLNEKGQIFFDNINTALTLIEDAKEKLSSASDNMGHINMLIKSKKGLIDKKLVNFIKENKSVTFHLTHSYSSNDKADYDIIVDDQPVTYKNYMQKPIAKEKIIIAASKNNPLCKKQLILNDLKYCSFITTSDESFFNTITKKICANAGFNPNIIIKTDNPLDMQNYIKEDFGICFLSERFIGETYKEDICPLNVADLDYTRITYIYLNQNKQISKGAKAFFDYIEEG